MEPGPMKECVLVVDDSPRTLEVLRRNLASRGLRVLEAQSVAAALELLSDDHVDLLITDLKMPGAGGLDLVRHVRENRADTGVIVVTGYPTVESAVEAIKLGAEEYLTKPFTDEELFACVDRAVEKLRLRRAADRPPPPSAFSQYGLVGSSEPMLRLFQVMTKAAASLVTVLVTGESGTGKEVVARAIHYSGPRAAGPFLPVHCGGIPEPLIESELFGYVKGSFTGATETRAGLFLAADGGTVFLDELGDAPASVQVKLLRVLQDRELWMVGSRKPARADVRVMAATRKDPAGLVKSGALREDLYFRLNVIALHVPPLRERGDDVPMLARHFGAHHARAFGKEPPAFTDEALAALRRYSWPGNVRELDNVIQRAVLMAERPLIDVADLPSPMRFAARVQASGGRTLAQVEAAHILETLRSSGGNRTRAAAILGIDRKTLREKLKRHGIDETET